MAAIYLCNRLFSHFLLSKQLIGIILVSSCLTITQSARIAPGAIVSPDSILRGDVTIGSGTIIQGRAKVLAEVGPINIGQGNIIEDTATIVNRLRSTQIVGNGNIFERGCLCEASKVGGGNIIKSNAYISRNVELTYGCIIEAGCSLTKPGRVPEGTIVHGKDCQGR